MKFETDIYDTNLNHGIENQSGIVHEYTCNIHAGWRVWYKTDTIYLSYQNKTW